MSDNEDLDETASGVIDGSEPTRSRHLRVAMEEFDRVMGGDPRDDRAKVVTLDRTRQRRRRLPVIAAAAAALLVIVGLSVRSLSNDEPTDRTAASAAAPAASAPNTTARGAVESDKAAAPTNSADNGLRDTVAAGAPKRDEAVTTTAPIDLGQFSDNASLSNAALHATPPVGVSTSAVEHTDYPCASVPLDDGTEVARFQATLRSKPLIVVVAVSGGSPQPVVGVLTAPTCRFTPL